MFSHVKATKQSGSGKNRRTVTVFDGDYFIFEFKTSLKGRHEIRESEVRFFKSFENFRFEDQAFMNKFKVTSNNDQELFELLTPKMITILKRVEEKNAGQIIYCFFNHQLHIAMTSSRKKLTNSLYSPITSKYSDTIQNEIKFLEDFAKELNLDHYRFKEA
jgi:hypothetical protein